MWPTPTTKGYGHASEGMTMIMRRKVEQGQLTEEEARKMMNGTTLRPPRMKEWMFPTPTARDYKDRGQNTNYEKAKKKGKLAGAVGGTLNPTWVEWLMGYPIGYLDSVPWETRSSLRSSKK